MKAAFRHILLAALLLRALLPVGWMPGHGQLGEAAFIICTADGSVRHGIPDNDDAAKAHQPCTFAATAKLFASPVMVAVAPPSFAALVIASQMVADAPVHHAARTAQSPRAPPLNA